VDSLNIHQIKTALDTSNEPFGQFKANGIPSLTAKGKPEGAAPQKAPKRVPGPEPAALKQLAKKSVHVPLPAFIKSPAAASKSTKEHDMNPDDAVAEVNNAGDATAGNVNADVPAPSAEAIIVATKDRVEVEGTVGEEVPATGAIPDVTPAGTAGPTCKAKQ
jgi:hypothetical protein